MFRCNEPLITAREFFKRSSIGVRALRILSFGCSIGEELASLKFFFPESNVLGCDINDSALALAQKSAGNFAEIFVSDERSIRQHGPYHLILASASLCLNPPPSDFATKYPFARFEESVGILTESLVPGGLLIVINASYRVRDTCLFHEFDVVTSDIVTTAGWVNVYSKKAIPFLIQVQGTIYAKGEAFQVASDGEVLECMFAKKGGQSVPSNLTLASGPNDFETQFKFLRKNTDILSQNSKRNPGIIEVTTEYDFGRDRTTGERGFFVTISWQSLAGPGTYTLSTFWIRPVSGL